MLTSRLLRPLPPRGLLSQRETPPCLDEHGLMFDGWQRYIWDESKKEVVYVKDQVAIPLDRKISVGKPSPMSDLKKRTTIFRADGVDMRDDKEVTEYGLRIHKLRTLGGYQPWKVKGE